MAEKFCGSFEDLKTLIAQLGYSGQWQDCGGKRQFRGQNGEVLNWLHTGTLQFQGRNQDSFKQALSPVLANGAPIKSPVSALLAAKAAEPAKRIFIVRGHDTAAKEQRELILMKLGLEPFILHNNDAGGRTLIEASEQNIALRAAQSALSS